MTLGYVSVGRMLSEVSSEELTEWIAYYEMNPWGPERDDFRAAMESSAISGKPASPEFKRFLPPDTPPPPPPDKSQKGFGSITRSMIAAGLPVKFSRAETGAEL